MQGPKFNPQHQKHMNNKVKRTYWYLIKHWPKPAWEKRACWFTLCITVCYQGKLGRKLKAGTKAETERMLGPPTSIISNKKKKKKPALKTCLQDTRTPWRHLLGWDLLSQDDLSLCQVDKNSPAQVHIKLRGYMWLCVDLDFIKWCDGRSWDLGCRSYSSFSNKKRTKME